MLKRIVTMRLLAAMMMLASLTFYVAINLRADAQTTRSRTAPQQKPIPRPTPTPPSSSGTQSTTTATPPAPDTDEEVVRVSTDLTNILFTAVDKDQHFVTALRREDVRVLEDGRPQSVSTFQRETDLPLSIAILIDTSESQTVVLPDEKAAARAFLDAVMRPEKDQSAIITFTGKTTIEANLTNDKNVLRRAIDRVAPGLSQENIARYEADEEPLTFEEDPTGYTNIWDTIYSTADEVLSKTPERTRRAIILLSDGDDTRSRRKKQEAIDRAIKANVVVYSIGIRDEDFPNGKMRVNELIKLSDATGGRAFFPRPVSDLSSAFAQIEQELRSQYLVAYTPTNKTFNGAFRQVRIEIVNPELRKQKLRLLYRQGYYARSGNAPSVATTPSK